MTWAGSGLGPVNDNDVSDAGSITAAETLSEHCRGAVVKHVTKELHRQIFRGRPVELVVLLDFLCKTNIMNGHSVLFGRFL